jgi:hypothetical protein
MGKTQVAVGISKRKTMWERIETNENTSDGKIDFHFYSKIMMEKQKKNFFNGKKINKGTETNH